MVHGDVKDCLSVDGFTTWDGPDFCR